MSDLTDAEFRALLAFRVAVRKFMLWSDREAAKAGLTSQQHQLLLVVRVRSGERAVSVTDVAAALGIRHHSAVGLVRRAEAMRLLERRRDIADRRVVRLQLTGEADALLARLSRSHLAELQRAACVLRNSEVPLQKLLADLEQSDSEDFT